MWYIKNQNELYHHGILGQKWGKRNGPPYPLGGGDYSEPEKRAIYKERQKRSNSIYNKKHFDEVLKKGTTLSTLSHDPNRTKGKDMFYAAHTKLDKHEYNVVLNKAVPKTIYDENGEPLGTGTYHKWRINNSVSSDLKVASEDSGAEQFRQLFKKDRDFYNFVTDPSRMESHIPNRQFRFKGYRGSSSGVGRSSQRRNANGRSAAGDLPALQLHHSFRWSWGRPARERRGDAESQIFRRSEKIRIQRCAGHERRDL